MEKKNPFVMTVGFKKEDPDHVYVTELLNTMGRGKAQFIVKAVLAYQELLKKGELHSVTGLQYGYEEIRQIVMQIIEEREKQKGRADDSDLQEVIVKVAEKKEEKNLFLEFGEDAMNDILASLAAFQE